MNWPIHPLAQLFPEKSREELDSLKHNMVERLKQGLPPLENCLLLLDDMIADGRNRYSAWLELAQEGACNDYFQQNQPPVECVNGLGQAWLRIVARNFAAKQLSAGQRAAVLLEAIDLYPDLKAQVDAITLENAQRQKEGKPLDKDDHGGTTAEQMGQMAAVGSTTMKQAVRLGKKSPDKIKQVAKGEKSLKAALAEADGAEKRPKRTKKPKNLTVDGIDLDLTLRAKVNPRESLAEIKQKLAVNEATVVTVLAVQVVAKDETILADGGVSELLKYSWEDIDDGETDAVPSTPPDDGPSQGGNVLSLKTPNDEFFE